MASRRSRLKISNFGIKSTYIHANQTQAAKLGHFNTGYASDAGVMSSALIKKSNEEFIKQVGVSPDRFFSEVEKAKNTMESSADVFKSKTIQEVVGHIQTFKDVQKDGSLSSFNKSYKSIREATASLTGLTQLAYQVRYSINSSDFKQKTTYQKYEKENREMIEYLSNFNTAKIVEQGLESIAKGRDDIAASLVLFELLKESVEHVDLAISSTRAHITHKTEMKITAADAIQEGLDDFMKAMNKQDEEGIQAALNKLNKALDLVNQAVKSKSGEAFEGMQALVNQEAVNNVILQVLADTVEQVSIDSVDLVGSKRKLKTTLHQQVNTATSSGFQPLKSLADLFEYNLKAIDMTQDVSINLNYKEANGEVALKNWGVSVKTYNSELVKRGVSIGTNLSLGRALALTRNIGPDGGLSYTQEYLGNTEKSKLLFNALVGLMANSDYVPIRMGDGTVELAAEKRARVARGARANKLYGKILDEIGVLIVAGVFNAPSIQFLNVNGDMIPAPVYMQEILTRISTNYSRSSTIVSYHTAQGAEVIDKISRSESTVARPSKKGPRGFVNYAAPALFRSASIKKALVEQQLIKSVKLPHLSSAHFREKFNVK